MADEPVKPACVWVKDTQDRMRGLHASCAAWLRLEPEDTADRKPYHTEVCLGCGRFLDATPPEREGTAPFDSSALL